MTSVIMFHWHLHRHKSHNKMQQKKDTLKHVSHMTFYVVTEALMALKEKTTKWWFTGFFNEPNQRIPQPPEFLLSFIKSMSTRNFLPRKTLHASEMAAPTPGQRQPLKLPSSEPKLTPPLPRCVCFPDLGTFGWPCNLSFGAVFGEFFI